MRPQLLEQTTQGLYCTVGDFHIDPRAAVDRAVITHLHADHARTGSRHYVMADDNRRLVVRRLGEDAPVDFRAYGEPFEIGGVEVSLHPAGHILGSAQVRIAHQGEVWVVSGDYKRALDPTCAAFEPVRCDTFVTESTFALPVYRWPKTEAVIDEIIAWWRAMADAGRSCVLFCYALGKAQRVLAHLANHTTQTIFLHGAMTELVDLYRQTGVTMPPTRHLDDSVDRKDLAGSLTLAPPSAAGSPWMRRFPQPSTAFCSGWMQIRGNRRRRGHDRGFILSDHADWPGLLRTIEQTGAVRVLINHGQTRTLARYLVEQGLDARPYGDGTD